MEVTYNMSHPRSGKLAMLNKDDNAGLKINIITLDLAGNEEETFGCKIIHFGCRINYSVTGKTVNT